MRIRICRILLPAYVWKNSSYTSKRTSSTANIVHRPRGRILPTLQREPPPLQTLSTDLERSRSVNFEGDSATDSVHRSARSHPNSLVTLPKSSGRKSACFGAWLRFPAGTCSRQPPTYLQAVRHGPTGCGCRVCFQAGYCPGSGLAPPGAARP